jgi:hypothetical protein
MTAGQSAQKVATSSDGVASWATRRSAAFASGAEGERAVALAVAPLSADGWVLLHDRAAPGGGNVDHVLIGPGGVVILDAKAWTGALSVTATGRLRRDNRDAHRSVTALLDVIAAVRAAAPTVPVSGGLVFIGNDTAHSLPSRLDGVGLCALENVVDVLRRKPQVLAARDIDATVAAVALALPAIAPLRLVRPEPVAAKFLDLEAVQHVWDHPIEDRYRFYIAKDWSNWSQRRTYLSTSSGVQLGWIDVKTHHVHHDGEPGRDTAPLLQRLIVPTALPDPDVSTINPVGRVTSRLLRKLGNDRRGVGHVVAKVWRKGDKKRLYITSHVCGVAPASIGSVDLMSGACHVNDPAVAGLVTHTWHVLFDVVTREASHDKEGAAPQTRSK